MTIVERFNKLTGYNISAFLTSYTDFVNNYYSYIVSYYKGEDIDEKAFNTYDELVVEAEAISGLLDFYSYQFDNAEYWELIDMFSNIQISLDTIKNLSRWMRSSRLDRFSSTVKVEYIKKQFESIENISKKAGNINFDDDWTDIAISNDLNEEAYTSDGGNIISISFSNNLTFDLKNIVDTLSTTNLYGKDIQKRFEISSGDIKTLEGVDSLTQTFETIFSTFKGSIPEFPEDGVSSESIGSNVNVINYPSMFRNILNMFQKDDRFSVVSLIDLYRSEDNVFMKIQAKTKIGDILLNEIPL